MSSSDWPEHFKRGLVVTAHADDAEYGCSGTVARLISEGWDFAYVLCTDGSKGSSDRNITEKELSAIRLQQSPAHKLDESILAEFHNLLMG